MTEENPSHDAVAEDALRAAWDKGYEVGQQGYLDRIAEAWDEGYECGVEDERTSKDNPGIAGCFCSDSPCRCFIAPACVNPYRKEAK